MLREIDQVLRAYEGGGISRRELVCTLGAVVSAALAGATPSSRAEESQSTFRSVGLNHVALRVSDVQRSRRFYVEHLGLRVLRDGQRNCFLGCGANQFVALFRADAPGLDHYCYTIDRYDAGAVMERLRTAGLEPERHEDRVYFDDPDGLTLQLAGEWNDYPGDRPGRAEKP